MRIKYKSSVDKDKVDIIKGVKIALSSTVDPCYSFCIPIACYLWKNVMGYTPIVFLIDEQEWGQSHHGSFVIDILKEMEIDYFFIDKIEGVSSSTLSQVSRLYSFAMCDKNDYIFTSDADMFPLSKKLFKDIDVNKEFYILTKYYDSHRYSMCYIGGYCRSWSDVMGANDVWKEKDRLHEVNRLLKKDMIEGLLIPHSAIDAYHYDELSFGRKMNSWAGFPDKVKITRQDNNNRVNLIWNRDESLGHKTDIHLARDGYRGDAWISLQLVLSNVLGDKVLNWVVDYRNRFVKKI